MQKRIFDLKTPDGLCDSYAAWPDDRGPVPAVLFLMDGFGPRERLWDMACTIAEQGYFVLMPNLLYRQKRAPLTDAQYPVSAEQVGGVFDQLRGFLKDFNPEMALKDAKVFFEFLDQEKLVKRGPLGIAGYCMGGGVGMRMAARYPERVAAVAAFHAGRLANDAPNSPHLLAPEIKARMYFGFADQDHSMPAPEIIKLESALRDAGVRFESEVMKGAAHGYTMSDLPMHQAAAEKRHWEKLFALLKETLPR